MVIVHSATGMNSGCSMWSRSGREMMYFVHYGAAEAASSYFFVIVLGSHLLSNRYPHKHPYILIQSRSLAYLPFC